MNKSIIAIIVVVVLVVIGVVWYTKSMQSSTVETPTTQNGGDFNTATSTDTGAMSTTTTQ